MDLTTTKTWQYNVNQSIAAQGTTALTTARVLRSIKNSLIGFASSPWAIIGSSNSVDAGLDEVDRWSTDSNVVWAAEGVAHSWIVLRQTGIASNFQVLINCGLSTTVDNIYVSISFTGFTGGSTTAKPTAVDELVLNNNSAWTLGANANRVLHVQQTNTGEQTRVFVWDSVNSRFTSFWTIEKITDASAGWDKPFYFMVQGGNLAAITTARLAIDTGTGKSIHNNALYGAAMTWNGTFSTGSTYSALHAIASTLGVNEINQQYDVSYVGAASSQVGFRGRHGRFDDLWWGLGGTVIATGAIANDLGTFDVGGTRTFAQFGQLIIPWNGSAISTS